MTIIEYMAQTVRKTTAINTREKRLYVSSLPADTPFLGSIVRHHWSIESMHWGLDVNLLQDKVKRKSAKAARNLDTILRMVYSIFSIWKGLRKKRSDKRKGVAELMRHVSMNFTLLMRFLGQKWNKSDFQKKITTWNPIMKIYPILNNLGKGKYVFIFILNERAVVDYVGNQHYVFNIRGNNYRLVVVVKFTIGYVFIRWVGTHKDYDKIDCSTI